MAHVLGKAARVGSMVAKGVNTNVPSRNFQLPDNVRKFCFNLSGYNQYGLYKHDLFVENEEVTEAIRRMPKKLQDERTFRMQRATQLSLMYTVLPKDQWVPYEEDMEKGRYLTPYLEEIEKEKKESNEWFQR